MSNRSSTGSFAVYPVAVNEPIDWCLAAFYRHATFGCSCGAASGKCKDMTSRLRWRDFNLKKPTAPLYLRHRFRSTAI